jgi:hypothetical protein
MAPRIFENLWTLVHDIELLDMSDFDPPSSTEQFLVTLRSTLLFFGAIIKSQAVRMALSALLASVTSY